MATPPTMSPRIEDLRNDLANKMPIQKATDRATLQAKYITDVMIQYLTWQARLIRPRPRSVVIWPEVTNSPHHAAFKPAIERLKSEIEAGKDVNAALSNQVRTSVYAGDIPTKAAGMTQDEWVKKAWKGKDRIRVIVDVHHLHMGDRQSDGFVARTGELLFVGVTHDQVFFLAIGDHDSFTDGSITKIMHDKLDAGLATAGRGAMLVGPMITLGGTQGKDTFGAIKLVKQIEALDKDLDAKGLSTDHKIRMDWDDVVLLDPNGVVLSRLPGRL